MFFFIFFNELKLETIGLSTCNEHILPVFKKLNYCAKRLAMISHTFSGFRVLFIGSAVQVRATHAH